MEPGRAPILVLWPRWAAWGVAAMAIGLVVTTLAQEGATPSRLAWSAVIGGIAVTSAVVRVADGGALHVVKAVVLIIASVMLADRPGAVILFVVVLLCAEVAVELPLAVGLGLVAFAFAATCVRESILPGTGPVIQNIAWPLGYISTFVGGLFVRAQIELAAELRSKQDLVASEAAAQERRRLARDIHDVIAHSMTVTMLHVSGARLALQDSPADVASALDALVEAERQGRQSLADIRRTVGLLKADDREDESQLAEPLPGAADVTDLVQSYVDAGQRVTWSVEGDLAIVPPTTGLVVYRVVQESMANAAKHAPGAAVTVELRVCQTLPSLKPVWMRVGRPLGRVDLEVLSGPAVSATPPYGGGGQGVLGMKERVAAVGGELSAGRAGDGWKVSARMPIWQDCPVVSA